MIFRRPPDPHPRALEVIVLGFGVLGLIGMSIVLLDAASRGLITWPDLPHYLAVVVIGCLPIFAMSYVVRRSRLKKAMALREYERLVDQLAGNV